MDPWQISRIRNAKGEIATNTMEVQEFMKILIW
jgi:hypothetical protein